MLEVMKKAVGLRSLKQVFNVYNKTHPDHTRNYLPTEESRGLYNLLITLGALQ